MKTIFIGGSKTVGTICKSAHTFIKSYIQVGCLFLCGDCYGADTALQTFLLNEKYSNVVIYYVGEKPRNNIGQWQSVRVDTEAEPGTFLYRRAKDIEMVNTCDEGFMIWDGKSKGTGCNIVDLLSLNKPVYVCENEFIQMELLKTFLEKGAISQAQYDKSAHDLTEKMGFGKASK